MPCFESFREGQLVIAYRGHQAPLGEIYTIIEGYKPVQVSFTKYYQVYRVEHTITKKKYFVYAYDILEYEPLFEDTTVHTMIFDPNYEFEREEE